MPFFKSTYNILKKPDEDEVHNDNWFDSQFLQLPPSYPWDYKREMKIEDVDIWEEIYFESGGTGLYASWCPYAEFYMIIKNLYYAKSNINSIETFYGKGAAKKAYKRAKELGMPISIKKIWIPEEDMWLYE